ncbi:hypothetical protein QBC40DRAFT_235916 [Triangularia verruculosa]|uniref:Tyrosinase copper-binding domain-containing protein n=1 Tax=Triangularia verruculosa TaxID=2587418 RepID=A0AAN6XA82_9PEZI|nr:hypothetical protein QBC40DRAFT_235916 [Triangularia verruculosa]
MQFLSALLLAGGLAIASPINIPNYAQAAIDSGLALKGLNALATISALTRTGGTCTPNKIKYRREWRTLSKPDRRKFIAAVKCLQGKPSVLPKDGTVPGAITLWDDLAYAHAWRTFFVHVSATFLVWHRYFLFTYESLLETECGWTQGLPYWEWGLDENNVRGSPLFDGSDTSIGSDGIFIPGRPDFILDIIGGPNPEPVRVVFPPGTGGGCIERGPFKDTVVRLGPFPLDGTPWTNETVYGNNPRCLDRDLNTNPIKRWSTFRNSTELILSYDNIREFQGFLEGDPRVTTEKPIGVHGGGHWAVGGITRDPVISPYDPAFYFHHNQLDRIYWIWQNLDFNNRKDVFGTGTWGNVPPSPNVTVEDFIDVLPHQPAIKIKDSMNTVSGAPFCYVYV